MQNSPSITKRNNDARQAVTKSVALESITDRQQQQQHNENSPLYNRVPRISKDQIQQLQKTFDRRKSPVE